MVAFNEARLIGVTTGCSRRYEVELRVAPHRRAQSHERRPGLGLIAKPIGVAGEITEAWEFQMHASDE